MALPRRQGSVPWSVRGPRLVFCLQPACEGHKCRTKQSVERLVDDCLASEVSASVATLAVQCAVPAFDRPILPWLTSPGLTSPMPWRRSWSRGALQPCPGERVDKKERMAPPKRIIS